MKRSTISIFILFFFLSRIFSQISTTEFETIVYKKIDTTHLILKVVYPLNVDTSKQYPAMIFFFGGGWKTGSISQFEQQAQYFSKRGIICFLADYRIESKHGTFIRESIMDAKTAMRFIRLNAKRFCINANQIIASGGSAGGHLAAATAMIDGCNEESDNTSVSPIPNALVLFNPALDLLQFSAAKEKIGKSIEQLSPSQNIRKNIPPIIIFHGAVDEVVPVASIRQFQSDVRQLGNRCDLHIYEGEKHGFFNWNRSKENFRKTVFEADKFLISLGYITGYPTIMNQQ